MEQLIILAVIGLISMIFKGKKPEENQKSQQRQPSAQQSKPDAMRKLKEMSQEMVKEIQREFQTEIEEPPSRQTPPISQQRPAVTRAEVNVPVKTREVAPPVERKTRERSATRESHRGRLSAHQGKQVWEESIGHHEMIPTSDQDLIKGIIFSEILGPPKAKQ